MERYEVLGKLGSGTFGVVTKARQRGGDKLEVAIKQAKRVQPNKRNIEEEGVHLPALRRQARPTPAACDGRLRGDAGEAGGEEQWEKHG